MASFRVIQVVDGDTFSVSPSWNWNGQSGDRVRPTGYDAPEIGDPGRAGATAKLQRLLQGNTVVLGTGYKVDRGRLVCDVYLNGRPLHEYFPEYA